MVKKTQLGNSNVKIIQNNQTNGIQSKRNSQSFKNQGVKGKAEEDQQSKLVYSQSTYHDQKEDRKKLGDTQNGKQPDSFK